jgi:hypothetical protein
MCSIIITKVQSESVETTVSLMMSIEALETAQKSVQLKPEVQQDSSSRSIS